MAPMPGKTNSPPVQVRACSNEFVVEVRGSDRARVSLSVVAGMQVIRSSGLAPPRGFSSQTGPRLLQKQRNRVGARRELLTQSPMQEVTSVLLPHASSAGTALQPET